MTLPSSGQISISQINSEFGRGNNLNAYRGTTWYTDAGGSGTFPSGAISMSDFWGKRATSPTFSFTISSNQTNADLRSLAVSAGWNQSSQLVATIASGVYISSNSTGTAGLTVTGAFPNGVTLNNSGTIVGMGGAGGKGQMNGTTGGAGGTALLAQTAVTVNNSGIIAGGGGGGGGGGYRSSPQFKAPSIGFSGGGGGGGRSSAAANSSGGARGDVWGVDGSIYYGNAGGSGTVSGAGGGGSPAYGYTSNYGGNGGDWGSGGASGSSGGAYDLVAAATSGGAGGNAVSGNGYITWTATGTRYGGIV